MVLLHCFYLLVFRSSITNESLPSLASQENEKHSSMMSFVVEYRCLVSSILVSEQQSTCVCFARKQIDARLCDISLLSLQATESEEQSDNDRSNCWPVYPVKIHKEQVVKWSTF